MRPELLKIREEAVGSADLIVTEGELDASTAPFLSDALRRVTLEHEGTVIVDLCETTFVDSAGISTLLNALRRLTRQRRRMVVVCPPGSLRRLFELLGLVGTFELVESRDDALASV